MLIRLAEQIVKRQANELRDRLSGLRPAVDQELLAFERTETSLPARAGLARCRTALDDLKQLFDPDATLASEWLGIYPDTPPPPTAQPGDPAEVRPNRIHANLEEARARS